jgi:hypothetical protein
LLDLYVCYSFSIKRPIRRGTWDVAIWALMEARLSLLILTSAKIRDSLSAYAVVEELKL